MVAALVQGSDMERCSTDVTLESEKMVVKLNHCLSGYRKLVAWIGGLVFEPWFL